MKLLLTELKTAILATLVLVIVVCGVYPLAVWAGAQLAFRDQANGSLIVDADGTVRGSRLLAQPFTADRYFHPRPSSAGSGYDGAASSGSNLGPSSRKLADAVAADIAAYRSRNGVPETAPVPADAVTRSASGLDPHISIANALLQLPRVARARDLAAHDLRGLIELHTDGRSLTVLGEPGVNVLTLNRALDALRSTP